MSAPVHLLPSHRLHLTITPLKLSKTTTTVKPSLPSAHQSCQIVVFCFWLQRPLTFPPTISPHLWWTRAGAGRHSNSWLQAAGTQPSTQLSKQPSTQLSTQPLSTQPLSTQPFTQLSTQISKQLITKLSIQLSTQPYIQLSKQPSIQLSTQPYTQLSTQGSAQPSSKPVGLVYFWDGGCCGK